VLAVGRVAFRARAAAGITAGTASAGRDGEDATGDGANRDMWNKCSVCKKPIAFGAPYLKCAISTCNRKRFQLYFCSDSCWDAHNPDQNHRNPAYTEHVAPKAP
jgi:hypothetical protein